MTYETAARIAQQIGTIYFALIFLCAAAYAFWPSNRETFDRAKHAPLNEDERL